QDQLPGLFDQQERWKRELDEAGFSEDASLLLDAVCSTWRAWSQGTPTFPLLPTSPAARFLLERSVSIPAKTDQDLWVSGTFTRPPDHPLSLPAASSAGVFVADMQGTMMTMRETIPAEGVRILTALLAIVVGLLWLTFRRVTDLLWVFLSLSFSLSALLGAMSLLGWTWNFYNLAAILLTVGAGLDYSIHMLLSLRNHRDPTIAREEVGQALFVCALSTVAGFGSLSWASNLGLASLGRVCALALFFNALVSIFLLPSLWSLVHLRKPSAADSAIES
ncbi:MAG: MMPL family transporter, partial [Verrucomicrobiota bacterium]